MIIEFSPSSITRCIRSRNCGELVRVLWLPAKFIRSAALRERCAVVVLASTVFVFLREQLRRMQDGSVKRAAGGEL